MPKVLNLVPMIFFERYKISWPEEWNFVTLDKPTDEEFEREIADADAIMIPAITPLPANVINAAKQLKLIQVRGVGFNLVDFKATTDKKIPLANNPGTNSDAVAEHAIGLILAGLRHTAPYDEMLKKGQYKEAFALHNRVGANELTVRNVGLLGLGTIGRETAKRLKTFKCKMRYYDMFRQPESVEKELDVEYVDFDTLIKESDVLSIHIPLMPETEKMISWDQFKAMKNNTLIINTSRGPVIDEEALIDALETDKIFGAALDTFVNEPILPDDPLINMSPKAMAKLTITPHIAGGNDEALIRMMTRSIDNIKRVLDGEAPQNVVNGIK